MLVDCQTRKAHRCRSAIAPIVLGCLITHSSVAGQWRWVPALEVGGTFTDNVELTPPGQERSDFITQISPRLSLHGHGRRLKLDFDYRMQNLVFLKNSEFNATNHQLQATGTTELIEDLLFLDARSSIGQVPISLAQGRVPVNTVTGATGNLANVRTFGISPYVTSRIGRIADIEARYRYDRVTSDGGISDSDVRDLTASLHSGRRRFQRDCPAVPGSGGDGSVSQYGDTTSPSRNPSCRGVTVTLPGSPYGGQAFTRSTWSVDYENRRENQAASADDVNSGDFSSENIDGEFTYALNRSWRALFRAGYANADFQGAQSQGIEDGTYVSAGAVWSPSRYLSVDATYGPSNKDAGLTWVPNARNLLRVLYRDRKVGLNPGGSWFGEFSHRTRRSLWTASYQEETTTSQQLLASTQFTNLFNPVTGEIVVNPDGQPVLIERQVTTLTNEVVLRKIFQASIEYRTGKSRYSLLGLSERREPQVTADNEHRYVTSASWAWRFAPRTESIFGAGWETVKFDVDDHTDDYLYLQLGLTRRMQRKVTGQAYYFHSRQLSDLAGNEYKENRITLLMDVNF